MKAAEKPGGGSLRAARLLLLFAIVLAAGLLAGELLARWTVFRGALARVLGRGELVAVTRGVGVYAQPGDETDAESLVIEANLRQAARSEVVTAEQIEGELQLFRDAFGDETALSQALAAAGGSEAALRAEIADHLRSRARVERQIAGSLTATDDELHSLFDENSPAFLLPPRYRARHLFLAAPEGSPPELIDAKRQAIAALALRVRKGETLVQLATEASEDEATKANGGDLGVFSEHRVPPEFFAAVTKLQVGQVSAPIRSRLGFHLAQLTEVLPERALSFEEARAELTGILRDEKRAAAVAEVAERLTGADYIVPRQP